MLVAKCGSLRVEKQQPQQQKVKRMTTLVSQGGRRQQTERLRKEKQGTRKGTLGRSSPREERIKQQQSIDSPYIEFGSTSTQCMCMSTCYYCVIN